MMLRTLKFSNFRVFDGDFEIVFPPPEVKRPYVVVFGENYHGKTTIIDAFRWAILGSTWTRKGDETERSTYVNYRKDSASVHLSFDVNGDEYVVERSITVEGKHPSREVVLDQSNVRKNGRELSLVDGTEALNRIFPRRVAGFSLFDGEQLARYEAELSTSHRASSPSTRGRPKVAKIREDVENLLGLPALQLTASDFAFMQRDAEKRYARRMQESRRGDRDAAKAELLSNEIEQKEVSLERLDIELEESTARMNELDEMRKRTEELRTLMAERDSLAESIKTDEKAHADLLKQRASFVASVWKQVIAPAASFVFERKNELIREMETRSIKVETMKDTLQQLKGSLSRQECQACGQVIGDEQVRLLQLTASKMEAELGQMGKVSGNELNDLRLDRAKVKKILPSDKEVVGLQKVETQMSAVRRQLYRGRERLKEVRKQIALDDSGLDAKAIHLDYTAEAKANGELEAQRNSLANEIDKRREELAALQRSMKPTESTQKDQKILDIVNSLKDIFERSVEVERDRMRQRLVDEASPIFIKLTGAEESIWGGLEIDQSFVVRTLDKSGVDKSFESSAGEAQLIALSVIGGLHTLSNAPNESGRPLLLDTPFGRLDLDMRRRVLRILPEWSSQIMLLVHSGELSEEEAFEAAGDSIYQAHSIRRIDTYSSHLEGYESRTRE